MDAALLARPRKWSSIPDSVRRFLFFENRPDWPYVKWAPGASLGVITYLYPVPRVRIRGAYNSTPPYHSCDSM
jgi:hypothetical protein